MITVKEEFLRHPKVRRAIKLGGAESVLLWLAMKAYATEQLTDGFIPVDDVDGLVDGLVDARRLKKALCALLECGRLQADGGRGHGLLERVEHGYQLHDYLDHEESSDEAKRRRSLKAARQKRWRNGRDVDGVDANVDTESPSTETPTRRDGDASPARTRAHVPPPLPSPQGSKDPSSLRSEGSPASQAPQAPPKRSNKPVRCPEDFAPSDKQTAALASKHGVAPERIRSRVPEFVWYWRDGKGAGKRRSLRGWAQAFGKRIDDEAKWGTLYAERVAKEASCSAAELKAEIDQADMFGGDNVPY